MAGQKIYYEATGIWSTGMDINAGDPLNAGPGTNFNLAGYTLTDVSYENLDGTHHVLSMGVGHKALLLDDTTSGPQGALGRIIGIDVFNANAGGQIIDLTSATLSYGDVTINGGSGADILMANAGDDLVKGGGGVDYVWGGSGDDSLSGGMGNDRVLGGSGDDLLAGGEGNDKITTGDGNDIASAGRGDDTILAGLGNQTLSGNSGLDVLDLIKVNAPAIIDQGKHLLTVISNGVTYQSHISGFEKIFGTESGTTFVGMSDRGLTLLGGAGNDHFHLKGGGDVLSGKGGEDTYDWTRKAEAHSTRADVIKDFVVGVDRLDMSDFLKGQPGLKNPTYEQVITVIDSADGVMVQARVSGAMHDVVDLVGVHTHNLSDLLLA